MGISDDGAYLLLAKRAGAKSAPFRVKVDPALVKGVEQAAAADTRPEVKPRRTMTPRSGVDRPSSKLTPREIQALLRQGRSVASIAKRAGVDPSWVERFEGPIVWERSGMASRAQRATLARPRMGSSALPLGEAVAANLRQKGVEMAADAFADSWHAIRRGRKGTWLISFSFPRRSRIQTAKWEYDPETSKVTADNALAAELGWVPRRRRRSAR